MFMPTYVATSYRCTRRSSFSSRQMSVSDDKAGGPTASTSRSYMYIGKYKLLKTIGKGNFARVKLARHIPTGQEVTKVREKEERERKREKEREKREKG